MKLEKDTAHFVVLVIALFSFMFGRASQLVST